ncbi:I78 family peptidase inhibitor [Pseudogemmobacter faecipullorum]|uniref:Peptidase inhibitor I78 family protein n=1 Tax=Pseudogemmobacter faecipullorum TaxID=2755041 RepID=A0ABS8CNV4_9RHOB|nr:I78 family peptidase inhibitor [Pseudogemmobacter faecipullorum]MCB5411057.1 hypothetical protein [Pseudogemmobacter faecipullorum]
MTLKSIALIAALPLALAACVETETTTVVPDMSNHPSKCGADQLYGLIGQPVSTLPARPSSEPMRILTPNGIASADYSPSRLNVKVDGRNRITELTCG